MTRPTHSWLPIILITMFFHSSSAQSRVTWLCHNAVPPSDQGSGFIAPPPGCWVKIHLCLMNSQVSEQVGRRSGLLLRNDLAEGGVSSCLVVLDRPHAQGQGSGSASYLMVATSGPTLFDLVGPTWSPRQDVFYFETPGEVCLCS